MVQGVNPTDTKSQMLVRHSEILKNVLFAQRNNPYFMASERGEENSTLAKTRFRHLILRQLPTDFTETKSLNGLKFEEVSLENDKVRVRLENCFEAVFYLEFDL